ncbi:MAG: NUDIX domain-containing protein [Thermoplasmata archaeon]|nr:NUDIX domain-containing protein [Thermoplasmata archaeon]
MTGKRRRFDQECVEGYLFVRRPLRVLLFRRPPARGRIWVPISGKVDRGDRSFSLAIRREVAEETGFRRFRRVSALRWVFPFRGPEGGRWRLHAFAVELNSLSTPRLSDEHDAFEWLEPSTAVSRLHYRDNRTALRRLLRSARVDRRRRVHRATPNLKRSRRGPRARGRRTRNL